MKKEANFQEIRARDWLDGLISRGAKEGASDIHIEPGVDNLYVRFRVNGIIQEIDTLPMEYAENITSCLKVMANLDITEKRNPQDGHIFFRSKKIASPGPIDLRLSIFPTVMGEAAVMRILNRKDLLFENIENLGMTPEETDRLRSVFLEAQGMILVTGPGGSGKTTTLYTILSSLQSSKLNIITLEDPVELRLKGTRQGQIKPDTGFDFAKGLRSILRQDPDVVMVGEIRDDETAEIAIRAALMGVLFFSTMHTTNSVGAIVRFMELKLPRSLIASALRVIIAQRLVRNICPHCKKKAKPSKRLMGLLNISKEDETGLFEGKGCNFCSGTGYLGRSGIFETMFIDKEIQALIIEGAPFTEIEKAARKAGMRTLQEAAVARALAGTTTLEEAIRVTPLS